MRRAVSIFLSVLIAALAVAAWLAMVFTVEDGVLSSRGLRSLRYFTVLSNLLAAGTAVAWIATLAKGAGPSPALRRLRYAATTSVTLTFFTVLCFLGPVFGFEGLYEGSNFWHHLVVPILAMVEFCAVDRSGPVPAKDARWAVLPMLAYAVFYVGNVLINGIGHGPDTNDWYGFMGGGLMGSVVVFAGMIFATALIALALRLPRRRA